MMVLLSSMRVSTANVAAHVKLGAGTSQVTMIVMWRNRLQQNAVDLVSYSDARGCSSTTDSKRTYDPENNNALSLHRNQKATRTADM